MAKKTGSKGPGATVGGAVKGAPTKKAAGRKPAAAKAVAPKATTEKPTGAVLAGEVTPPAAKKVSQNLIETIKKRKEEQAKKEAAQGGPNQKRSMFGGRPGVRRGRRPKRPVEYTPVNSEEESYEMENDYEGIEYETGVQLKDTRDDGSFNLNYDDYDDELNFDR